MTIKTIRAFFAIPLPIEAKSPIAHIKKAINENNPGNDLRWTELANMHITLQFLPSVAMINIPQMIENVSAKLKTCSAFKLTLGALEFFPSIKNPIVISLEVGPEKALNELAKIVGQGIVASHYPIENRPFKGHLTLARLNPGKSHKLQLDQIAVPPIPAQWVNEICLYESRPSHLGSFYIPLHYFKLPKKI